MGYSSCRFVGHVGRGIVSDFGACVGLAIVIFLCVVLWRDLFGRVNKVFKFVGSHAIVVSVWAML